jgi:SAM-dependent methyltransferase
MDQKEEKAWFQDWFSSPYYGLLYRHRNDDEAHFFIQNLVEKNILRRGDEVLDLACGNGRHSRYLAEMGLKVSGIDLSPEQIGEAQEHSAAGISYFVGDMRSFSLGISFDVIVNFFTSFGYFDTREENLQVLSCVREHLRTGGIFVLDYFNADLVSAGLPVSGETTIESIRIAYNKHAVGNMVVKDIDVEDGGEHHYFREKVQLIGISDFSALLDEAGFEVLHTFGAYSLEPFEAGKSDRLILIATRK